MRSSAASVLIQTELHVKQLVETASLEQLIELVEAFSPTRSLGPEWSRTFELVVERLWTWADPAMLAQLEATFRARGEPWAAVANNFTPERGETVRARLKQPSWARLPAFTIG